MKVALYARVSLEEGNKEDRRYQEPENQLEPLRAWAKAQGWEIITEYVDRGSGADPNRQEFRKMLQDAMLLRFQTILVWKLDRFSRENMSQVVGRIQKLRERNVGLRSLTESWVDTAKENPVSELILAVMGWAAAEERRKISERTKAGIARRRAIGQWKGGRPRKKEPPLRVEGKTA
jgi:DNA invertase Pin-like site-specific DNA recombinase